MTWLLQIALRCLVMFLPRGGVGDAIEYFLDIEKPNTDYSGQIEAMVIAQQEPLAPAGSQWEFMEQILDRAKSLDTEFSRKHRSNGHSEAGSGVDFSVLRDDRKSGADQGAEQDAARAVLKLLREEKIFQSLKSVVRSGQFVRQLPKGQPLIEFTPRDVPKARALARAAAAEMRVAHLDGDYSSYLDAFEGVCGLGQIYLRQGLLIDRLIGTLIFDLAVKELEQGILVKPLPAYVLRECKRILEHTSNVPSLSLSIEAARLEFHDTIQWSFSDSGDGDGHILPGSRVARIYLTSQNSDDAVGISAYVGWFVGFFQAHRRETLAKEDRIFAKVLEYAGKSRTERARANFNCDAEIHDYPNRFVVLKIITPNLDGLIVSEDIRAMSIAGARQVLATEMFAAEHDGQLPDSVGELVPRYLADIPVDPISDKPFGYRILSGDERDKLGRRYLVYSYGGDRADNQGKEGEGKTDRMRAINSVNHQVKGIDFVINAPPDRDR